MAGGIVDENGEKGRNVSLRSGFRAAAVRLKGIRIFQKMGIKLSRGDNLL
jgi:hypothetical protein